MNDLPYTCKGCGNKFRHGSFFNDGYCAPCGAMRSRRLGLLHGAIIGTVLGLGIFGLAFLWTF